MNIYSYKAQFEQLMLSSADTAPPVESAWAYFKDSVQAGLEENYIDQIGFSAGYAGTFDLRKVVVHYDKDVFRVWFGRIIDAEGPKSWNFAEIDFYYHYAMNHELRILTESNPRIGCEVFYRKSDEQRIIKQKRDAVFRCADGKPLLWDTLRELKPISYEIRFSLQ